MAKTIFKISTTLFAVCFAIFIMAIFSWTDLFATALSDPVYDNTFGDIIKATLMFSDYIGWYDIIVMVISGFTSWLTKP